MSNVANLNARFTATIIDFQREVQRMQRLNQTAMARIQQQHQQSSSGIARAWRQAGISQAMQQQVSSVTALTTALRNVAPVLAAAFSVKEAAAAADMYTRFTNSLKVAGLEGSNLAEVQQQLFDIAQKNGSALEPLGQLYGRVSQSAKELGVSQREIVTLTSTVAAAIRVQGGDAASASGALLQLSQALGASTVRAEEFNSINEGAAPLLQAAAAASDKYAGSVAKMRADVLEGNLSSRELFDLIIKGSAELEQKAAKAPLTIAASFQVLQNALTKFIGQSDQTLGVSAALAGGIKLLADNLDTVLSAIMAVSAFLLSRMVVSLAASTAAATANAAANLAIGAALSGMTAPALAASAAMKGLNASMAFFGGPIGLAITAVAAAIAGLGLEAMETDQAMSNLSDEIDNANKAIATADGYAGDASKKVKSLGGEATTAGSKINAFAGEVGNAATKLYQLAEAKKAAALADLEAERVKVSTAVSSAELRTKGTRRRLFADELSLNGNRQAATLGESLSRGGRWAVGELKDLWTGGAHSAELEAQVQEGRQKLREINAAAARLNALPLKDFADEARAGMGGGGDPKKKGKSGPTAEEIAQKRAMLELETQLMVARERGDLAEIQRLEDKLALLRMINQFESAGYSNAEAKAKAEDLYWQVQLARREARMNTVRESDMAKPFDPDSSFVSTSDAMGAIKQAFDENEAEIRDRFSNALRGGLEAAIEGGWPGLVEYMGNMFRQRLLDNIVNSITNAVFSSGASGGGGLFAAIGSFLMGGHASGTDFSGGGLRMVGESGPELMMVPRGTQVAPNNLLRHAFDVRGSGGSGATAIRLGDVHVHADRSVVTSEIQQWIQAANLQTLQAARSLTATDFERRGRKRLI